MSARVAAEPPCRPITVALVWHDFPSSWAATKNLVNDLDLGVLLNR
jgi:hypothetical protein